MQQHFYPSDEAIWLFIIQYINPPFPLPKGHFFFRYSHIQKILTQLCTFATVNIVQVITVLSQEFWICSIKGQTISACFQFRYTIVALPVFITWDIVWIETKIIGTFEVVLGNGWNREEEICFLAWNCTKIDLDCFI